jgi:hypothetical protein
MRFADVLSWRWTPTFALVGGSLVFVLLVIAIVPDQVGDGLGEQGAKASASSRSPFSRPGGSSSTHALAPLGAPPPAASNHGHAREARETRERRLRERRQQLPATPPGDSPPSTPPYQNLPVDRLFNRNPALPAPLPDDALPPEPPPAAAAPAEAPPAAPAST